MSKIDHPVVKKAFYMKLLGLGIGLALILGTFACWHFSSVMEDKSEVDAISFAQAYNEDRLNEDIMVYVEVTREPYEFAYRDNGPHYYFIYDEYDWYIMQSFEGKYKEIVDAIKKDGSYYLVGSIQKIGDEEIIDYALETYNEGETDPDLIMDREGFDNYFRGVMINANGGTHSSSGLWSLGFFMLMGGIVVTVIYLIALINYFSFMSKLSDYQAQYIANELYNPQTVHIDRGNIYMTTTCLLSLGHRMACIPYSNILWAYRYQFRYWFFPIYSNVAIIKRDFSKETVAVLPGILSDEQVIGMAFNIMRAYNPQILIGYTTQNQTYVRELRKQGVAPYNTVQPNYQGNYQANYPGNNQGYYPGNNQGNNQGGFYQ